jgi:hypothetical protein
MISEKEWLERLYNIRNEPDKLLIMITKRRYELNTTEKEKQLDFISSWINKNMKEKKKVMARKYCYWERVNQQFCGTWTEQTCNDKIHDFTCTIPDICPDCGRKTKEAKHE